MEETKQALEQGSETLNDCYRIMSDLQQTISESNTELTKMHRVAEDLLYEAKCQVAIGDEDPREANPQFSIRAFKDYIKQKRRKEEPTVKVASKLHKKRKEPLAKERDTNKPDPWSESASDSSEERMLEEMKYQ